MIVQPVEGFPEIYDDYVVEEIMRRTRCQPYLVQLLCSVLVEHLNREHHRRTTLVQSSAPQCSANACEQRICFLVLVMLD